MDETQYLHEVAITAIISKRGKYLITQRSATKKRFPGKWTVPGGRLDRTDYGETDNDTTEAWYNILEKTLRREVLEETGLKIKNIVYLTSLVTAHAGHVPQLVISCVAEYSSGKIKLQKEELDDYKWVTAKDARKYDLIDGIYDEIVMADKIKKKSPRIKKEWFRVKKH